LEDYGYREILKIKLYFSWLKICVTLAENALSTPGRPSMEKCKKTKIFEENRTFNEAWADSFVFTSMPNLW